MEEVLKKIAEKSINYISPYLSNYHEFHSSLTKVIKVKEEENVQFSFDVKLDQLIKNELKDIPAKIYSEESGWFTTSDQPYYKIVYDPFCNSSLASRDFREAAMGISVFSMDNTWLASMIIDYQSSIYAIASNTHHTVYYDGHTHKELKIHPPTEKSLADSWVVLTLENKEERSGFERVKHIFEQAGRIIVSSGHIYWLKLAMGTIDAYLDPIGGEKLYEMFACTIAQQAGCTVSDIQGKIFDPSAMLTQFEKDGSFIYYPVATRSVSTHTTLLQNLS